MIILLYFTIDINPKLLFQILFGRTNKVSMFAIALCDFELKTTTLTQLLSPTMSQLSDPDKFAVDKNIKGAFKRSATEFHDKVVDDDKAKYPAEADRYHLYYSTACPWCHRVRIRTRAPAQSGHLPQKNQQ